VRLRGTQTQEVLLVADAMTGQDAVNIAKSFNERLGIDGIILTRWMGTHVGRGTLYPFGHSRTDQVRRRGREAGMP